MTKFFIGLLLGIGISYLAYRARALDGKGAVAAGILGTIVFGLAGVGWAIVLLTFFISSSVLSKISKSSKQHPEEDFAKGSRRDAGQVAANGGAAGVLALMYFFIDVFIPGSNLPAILWIAFASSLAAANADTWATELGMLNPGQPVLLTTLKRVPNGTSGAVSPVGTLAALAGSALVGAAAVLCSIAGWSPAGGLSLGWQFTLIVLGGMVGSCVDSFLGATIQVIYYCPVCRRETERHPTHSCGAPTERRRGLRWLNNDWVNAACTVSGGLMGLALSVLVVFLSY